MSELCIVKYNFRLMENNFLIIAAIGIISGLLGGLLGLGGAIIIIPALALFLGYSQQLAQGTALIMMVLPVGALAAYQYYQKGFVDIKASLILAAFFFVGGYFGAKFATQIPELFMKRIFAVLLVVIAVKMWFFDRS
ncbi:MAG TPA: sulfite exporter TauE/SafE family protein [Bacteroidia bacterium]|nr:sulfite exporter TauE/SafE family protein [Bacteroidia bacterium]